MIANITPPKSKTESPAWHVEFLKMLPTISRSARITFRKARPELKQELVQEVIVNCFAAFARLVELGKTDQAYPTVLVRFAIGQVRGGRRIGNRLNIRDVMSNYAQFRKGFQVARLDQFDLQTGEWKEVLVEDGRAGPAETAAARLDFAAWLRRLPARLRKVALALGAGETTKDAAEQFHLSPARVSQLRRWLKTNWDSFQGEAEIGGRTQPVAA